MMVKRLKSLKKALIVVELLCAEAVVSKPQVEVSDPTHLSTFAILKVLK